MKITCFDEVKRLPIHPKKIETITKKIISVENHDIDGQINIVFVDNEYIHALNEQFLGHNYPTDVISFPLEVKENIIEGEIYISLEQAAIQAKGFQVTFEEETWRLIIHGILHLLGQNDQSKNEKEIMTQKEDFYLQKYELTERNVV